MLSWLFPRLTADPARGADLFRWAVTRARDAHWYVEGGVPDTIDGRFATLATIIALAIVRLELAGDPGNGASVALTERFIEAMEAEHREMGLGDPKLGRTVRKLVGSLAERVGLWRAIVDRGDWAAGARESLYSGEPSPDAVASAAESLRELWVRLKSAPLEDVAAGRIE